MQLTTTVSTTPPLAAGLEQFACPRCQRRYQVDRRDRTKEALEKVGWTADASGTLVCGHCYGKAPCHVHDMVITSRRERPWLRYWKTDVALVCSVCGQIEVTS